jgi:hypothetical protein
MPKRPTKSVYRPLPLDSPVLDTEVKNKLSTIKALSRVSGPVASPVLTQLQTWSNAVLPETFYRAKGCPVTEDGSQMKEYLTADPKADQALGARIKTERGTFCYPASGNGARTDGAEALDPKAAAGKSPNVVKDLMLAVDAVIAVLSQMPQNANPEQVAKVLDEILKQEAEKKKWEPMVKAVLDKEKAEKKEELEKRKRLELVQVLRSDAAYASKTTEELEAIAKRVIDEINFCNDVEADECGDANAATRDPTTGLPTGARKNTAGRCLPIGKKGDANRVCLPKAAPAAGSEAEVPIAQNIAGKLAKPAWTKYWEEQSGLHRVEEAHIDRKIQKQVSPNTLAQLLRRAKSDPAVLQPVLIKRIAKDLGVDAKSLLDTLHLHLEKADDEEDGFAGGGCGDDDDDDDDVIVDDDEDDD